MKLIHRRKLGGVRMESVQHYTYGDQTADNLAATIRTELGCKARVVQDRGTGYRHVFVPLANEASAREIARRREFS